MDAEEALVELARRQWGVFSRAQALSAGLSLSAIRRRLTSGAWVQVRRRVYRHAGGHDSWHQSVRGATLSLGPQALASHLAAGFLWGLDGVGMGAPQKIDVTVPDHLRLSAAGVTIHRTVVLPRTPGMRDKIPVMPLARTLLDLTSCCDERSVELALDSAIRQYPGTLIGVQQELDRWSLQGCPGSKVLVELVGHRRKRTTDSGLEVDVDRELRLAGFPPPVTQHTIRDANGVFVARVDLSWPQFRIVLFADSRKWT